MTRRKFIQKILQATAAITVGAIWLAEKTGLRKFVRAERPKKYPGVVRPLGDINNQSKWSG